MTTPAKSTAPAEPQAKPAPPAPPPVPPYRPPAPFRPLAVGRLRTIRSSECSYGNLHGAVLPKATRFDDVLLPDFWSLVAGALRPGDQIEVTNDSQDVFARLFVRQVGGSGNTKTRASVAVLEHYDFDQLSDANDVKTHEVRHQGLHLKWTVVRLSDNRTVGDGYDSPTEAEAALRAIVRGAAAVRSAPQ